MSGEKFHLLEVSLDSNVSKVHTFQYPTTLLTTFVSIYNAHHLNAHVDDLADYNRFVQNAIEQLNSLIHYHSAACEHSECYTFYYLIICNSHDCPYCN